MKSKNAVSIRLSTFWLFSGLPCPCEGVGPVLFRLFYLNTFLALDCKKLRSRCGCPYSILASFLFRSESISEQLLQFGLELTQEALSWLKLHRT